MGATIPIDGVFVPFTSKEGSYIDRLVADEKAKQEAAAASAETASADSSASAA